MQILSYLLMAIIPLVLAITLHEAGHAWMAKKFGDNTAYSQGRVSLNPLVHIDPLGTILIPCVLFVLTGMIFGWAKPVPVNESRLRNPKVHARYVTAAGPGANLLMAIGWAIIAFLINGNTSDNLQTVEKIAIIGVSVNILFMVFNLIPILPLDGGRILQSFLPFKAAQEFGKTEQYGQWVVLILAITGILGILIKPITSFLTSILLF